MIFNEEVIRRKSTALQKLAERGPQIVADLTRLFGGVRDVRALERPWYPGGGAILLTALIGGEEVFIKIKDKTLQVESRLESEPGFPQKGALDNEAMYCGLLIDDPHVPKLKAYKEDGEYAYAVFERLIPFEQGMRQLNSYERYCAFRDVEDLLLRLYDKGIVHTDVHEKNILFRGKQAVLCDFEEARLLFQDVPFEQSLDVVGKNIYGDVGEFPPGYGIDGLTCLNRLRQVFKPLIKENFQALLDQCHFSNDCAFNADELQDKDERIYQSIDLGDKKIAGQRPMHDHRHEVLGRLLPVLARSLGSHMHVVDIGSNLGTLSLTAARCDAVAKVTGLEAFPEYVYVSQILGFLADQDKVHFAVHQAGNDPMPKERIDVLLLFSVYHHIREKDAFLQDLARNRPRMIVGEMAVQDRFYTQRNGLENELRHIGNALGYKTLQVLGFTKDYQRPICVFSDEPPLDRPTLDSVMGSGPAKIPAAAPVAAPVVTTAAMLEVKKNYPVRVSIVLPTYNHARYLTGAVQGVLRQTFQDFELIIVNDGSTDETAGMLAGLQQPQIRVVTQNNQGLPTALNNGFAVARGEYWTWTSADNVTGPTWLEELVKALDTSPPDVGYAMSSFAYVDEQGRFLSVGSDQKLETWRMLVSNGNASFLYKSELARQAGPYDPSLNGAEDMDMWVRMSQLTRAVFVESVLYYYRMHASSMTQQMPEKIQTATRGMVNKLLASSGGAFDVDRFFPGIKESANPAQARWQARVWLAARLVNSPFCPMPAVADLLKAALHDGYEPNLVGNIVHIYAKVDAWDAAAETVNFYEQKAPSDILRRLSDIVARKDKAAALQTIPFVTVADDTLVFDRKEQLSRVQMFMGES